MKTVVISILMMFCGMNNSSAQSVVFNNDIFKAAKTKAAKDTLVTAFKWEDSKGKQFPIIINKANGKCYTWRKSSKTGKLYKSYLPKELSKQVANKLNITYKEK
jgi:hypothetical protein